MVSRGRHPIDESPNQAMLLRVPPDDVDVTRKGRYRDAEAARLKALGMPLVEIAKTLGMDTTDDNGESRAAAAIRRALAGLARFAGDEMRLMEFRSLDELEWAAWKTLGNLHVIIQQGRIVRDDDGAPVEDDRFILEVIDRILKIKERRAKMMGLDAPTRSEILTIDSVEQEIARLEAEVRRQNVM